ncbi:DUF2155 domain-containing protein, partial [Rhodopseudomonas sp. BR0M22]|nr:DUF2155 domain-containing protein [Rhodopseudomonas sp. BR0M22]
VEHPIYDIWLTDCKDPEKPNVASAQQPEPPKPAAQPQPRRRSQQPPPPRPQRPPPLPGFQQ